jgi:hypothetical protein
VSTEIEFYQRLSEYIPEEAARLIAERMTDRPLEAKIDAMGSKVDALAAKVDAIIAQLDPVTGTVATKVEVERLRSSFFRWNLAFFVPLWVGTYAVLVTMVLRGSP